MTMSSTQKMHTAITLFNTWHGREERLEMERRLRTADDKFAELTRKDGFFERLEGETGIKLNELFPRNIDVAAAANVGDEEENKEALYNGGGADLAREATIREYWQAGFTSIEHKLEELKRGEHMHNMVIPVDRKTRDSDLVFQMNNFVKVCLDLGQLPSAGGSASFFANVNKLLAEA